jgi:hypothetical protein
MALQSVWYYSNLPEDIVNIIERDLTENFDPSMGDSRFTVMLSTKKKETHKIPGYQQLTGLLGSYGTTYKEQIVRTFCMT